MAEMAVRERKSARHSSGARGWTSRSAAESSDYPEAVTSGQGSGAARPRTILYTGKGGVGKTSVAAATARRCAARGLRTVILSTDPAHSLGDSLEARLGPDPAIADQITVVILGPDASSAEQAHVITQVASGRGIGVVIAGDDVDAAASILIDADGTASLTGLAEQPVRFVAFDVPSDTSTAVERVLHPVFSQAASVDTRSLIATLDDAALDTVAMVDATANDDGGPTITEADLLAVAPSSSVTVSVTV